MQKIYSDIDTSKFNPDIDIPKALQMIWWILEGFALSKQKSTDLSKFKEKTFSENMINEMNEFFVMLKKSF